MARRTALAKNPKRLIRPPIDPSLRCPCDSMQSAAACCLCADGNVRKYLASLQPRPPRTGYSQAGCYLRGWAMNMLVPDTQPAGSWAGLTETAKRFLAVSDTYGSLLSDALTAQSVDRSNILHHLV